MKNQKQSRNTQQTRTHLITDHNLFYLVNRIEQQVNTYLDEFKVNDQLKRDLLTFWLLKRNS